MAQNVFSNTLMSFTKRNSIYHLLSLSIIICATRLTNLNNKTYIKIPIVVKEVHKFKVNTSHQNHRKKCIGAIMSIWAWRNTCDIFLSKSQTLHMSTLLKLTFNILDQLFVSSSSFRTDIGSWENNWINNKYHKYQISSNPPLPSNSFLYCHSWTPVHCWS